MQQRKLDLELKLRVVNEEEWNSNDRKALIGRALDVPLSSSTIEECFASRPSINSPYLRTYSVTCLFRHYADF